MKSMKLILENFNQSMSSLLAEQNQPKGIAVNMETAYKIIDALSNAAEAAGQAQSVIDKDEYINKTIFKPSMAVKERVAAIIDDPSVKSWLDPIDTPVGSDSAGPVFFSERVIKFIDGIKRTNNDMIRNITDLNGGLKIKKFLNTIDAEINKVLSLLGRDKI